MKTIALSQNLFALVDDSDYADLNQFKWHAFRAPHTFYAQRQICNNGKLTSEYMHRRILNAKPGESVDHKNHNGLDCQRHNIRKCTQTQNNGNAIKRVKGSSIFKGVCWHKAAKKWEAQIQCQGKLMRLGFFDNDKVAAHTYDTMARKLFGEFAFLNFPE